MAKKKQTELVPTAQDIQLLLRIRNSQFTKSTELCDIALRAGIAKSKPPFYARMEKLINGGLIEVVEEHAGKYSIHAITKLGFPSFGVPRSRGMTLSPSEKDGLHASGNPY